VLVARAAERGSKVQEEIKSQTQNPGIDLVLSDLSSLSSVRNATAIIKSRHENIDVLINNVAIYKSRHELSTDGFELMFVTNHLGPFLLTYLLLGPLMTSGSARILNISAPSSTQLDFDDLQREKKFNSLNVFGATKMMNETSALMRFFLHLASAPAERVAVDIIRVELHSEFEKVARCFFLEAKESEASAYVHDRAAQKRLWEISSELVGVHEVDIPSDLTMSSPANSRVRVGETPIRPLTSPGVK